jgi:hypothetical protein
VNNIIKIVICTERGILEKYSLLMCRSLRQFGGEMSQTEIYSIAPRKGYYPSKKTIFEFEKLGVKHENLELNKRYKNYPLANKPFVCEYIEEKFPNDTLVFIDSDQIILNEPTIFNSNSSLLLRMVDRKGIGFNGEKDINYNYWEKLFSLLHIDIKHLKQHETSSGEVIYPYFNSGLIVSHATLGLFKQWRINFERIVKEDILPKDGSFFLEQSIFSATVMQMKLPFEFLPNSYNYPFSLHDSISNKLKINDFDSLYTAHYHDLFITKPYPAFLTIFLATSEKGRWLQQQIQSLNIKPESLLAKYYNKVKKKLSKNKFK